VFVTTKQAYISLIYVPTDNEPEPISVKYDADEEEIMMEPLAPNLPSRQPRSFDLGF
jgi:hypothetical protein